jgi:hypothetical protein
MRHRRALFVATFLGLVLLALGAVEAGLTLFGYGVDSWIFERHRYVNGSYVENNGFYNRYFDRGHWSKKDPKGNMIRNVFRHKKTSGMLRGFLLGESAAQGFPYHSNQTFGKMIEAALASTGRYEKVELVNVAASAISSYAIRDIARHLGEYEPDFLVIYAGNNEYYGTVSESTGGTHASRTLYLQLRDYHLFELAFDVANGEFGRPIGGSTHLMSDRFANRHYPKNTAVDQRVAENFVSNIDAIVSEYAGRIPVILVEPVANLVDMPPFAGEDDAKYLPVIEPYAAAVRSGDLEKARKVHDESRSSLGAAENATLRYLDGLYARLLDPKSRFQDELVAARDLDVIPFRPRTAELDALRAYAREKAKSVRKLHFVPTYDVLAARAGAGIFGSSIFLDHVHFNQAGHRLIAEVLAKKIGDALDFDDDANAKMRVFFSDPRAVTDAVHALPYYRLYANIQLGSLLQGAPYSSMAVKFEPSSREADEALQELGPDLVKAISGKSDEESFKIVVNHYMQRDEFKKAHEMLIAENFAYPGSSRTYLNLAHFCSKFGDLTDQAETTYRLAYLYSGKDREIYEEMKAFLVENNRQQALTRMELGK